MKTFIYDLYFLYFKKFPINRGKTFVGRLLYKLLGDADFNIGGLYYNLNINSLIDRYILIDGDYDIEIFNAAKKALTNGGIFLDIGANFGYFSIMVSKIPNVIVFSFEPSLRELKRLHKNIYLNNSYNITVFPFCLGNENKLMDLNLCDNSNPGMNSLLDVFSTNNIQKTQCYRLDNLLTIDFIKNVQFIKIDVEGFEEYVLKGTGKLLENYSGQIVLEVTYYYEHIISNYNADLIYDYLESYGFKSKYGRRYAKQYNDYFEKSKIVV